MTQEEKDIQTIILSLNTNTGQEQITLMRAWLGGGGTNTAILAVIGSLNNEPDPAKQIALMRGWRGSGRQETVVETAPFEQDETDAADLMEMDIPEQRWVIPDVLPEGFGVLASAPKIGKTRLSLQVMIASTLGDEVLGKTVERRPVLFYCLENSKGSIQKAFHELLHGRRMPSGLLIRWNALRLQSGLEQEVSTWLDTHEFGLVFIDMLAKVRPAGGKTGKTSYDDDYAALSPMHSVAKAHPGCTIVILTHDRKAASEDWATRITGSRGIVGVGDFALYIDRKRADHFGTIRIDGRDMGDVEAVPVKWDDGWYAQGTLLVVVQRSPIRENILSWLDDNGPALPSEVAIGLDVSVSTANHRLLDMLHLGEVERIPRGLPSLPPSDRAESARL
jgi:AAA domain